MEPSFCVHFLLGFLLLTISLTSVAIQYFPSCSVSLTIYQNIGHIMATISSHIYSHIYFYLFPILVIECPQLSSEDDIYLLMSGQNRTYGSRVHFSCSVGYRLIGSEFVTCLKNRTWSDDVPRCEGMYFTKLSMKTFLRCSVN